MQSRQRTYAILLSVGACILLYRAFSMLFLGNAFQKLVFWVFSLLVIESLVDLTCLITAIRWALADTKEKALLPLRLGAAATILHAIRVLIYVLGRIGPWHNFDLKITYASQSGNLFWIWFASVLSLLGIWKSRR